MVEDSSDVDTIFVQEQLVDLRCKASNRWPLANRGLPGSHSPERCGDRGDEFAGLATHMVKSPSHVDGVPVGREAGHCIVDTGVPGKKMSAQGIHCCQPTPRDATNAIEGPAHIEDAMVDHQGAYVTVDARVPPRQGGSHF